MKAEPFLIIYIIDFSVKRRILPSSLYNFVFIGGKFHIHMYVSTCNVSNLKIVLF